MGILLSRFRRKESTKELLEKIQDDINRLEEYKENTEQRRKKLVGSLVIYSFVFFLISAILCYLYYLPPSFKERLLYATPFAGFIILIILLKKSLSSYYRWKVNRNEKVLLNLKKKKTEILNQVMETETYKVAKEILETHAPEILHKNQKSSILTQRIVTPSSGELRKRTVQTPASSQSYVTPLNRGSTSMNVQSGFNKSNLSLTGSKSHLKEPTQKMSISPVSFSATTPQLHLATRDGNQFSSVSGLPPGPPMPRPVLPRERGILDRFVEYLVGDGPSNRYALVCRQCESHNGMALKDEFPYIAFRCAYCYYWNPARKQKPPPPILEPLHTENLEKLLKEGLSEDDEANTSKSGCDLGKTEIKSTKDTTQAASREVYAAREPQHSESSRLESDLETIKESKQETKNPE